MGNMNLHKVTMSDDALNAVDELGCTPTFFRYHNYLTRWATREGRREGQREGANLGERRALLAMGARLTSPDAFQRLSTLPLKQLRVEVEARIAALAGPQRQG